MTDSNSKDTEPPTEKLDPEAAEEGREAEEAPFERRSAQAMVATYLQMSRYAELAHFLHGARLRSTEARVTEARDLQEVERLQRQLEAQRSQGESIDVAVGRFRLHAQDLKSFSEAGLTPEDFAAFGIDELVGSEPDPLVPNAGAHPGGKGSP